MFLKDFHYKIPTWELTLSDLQPRNLFVGKNSVGKSKAIRALARSAGIIMQSQDVRQLSVRVDMTLLDGKDVMQYHFSYIKGEVQSEKMTLSQSNNSVTEYITRSKDIASLGEEVVNVPKGKLTIHVRRDTVLYPYIEKLFSWAQGIKGLSFNEIDSDEDNGKDAWQAGAGISLYEMVEAVKKKELTVVRRMREVGYPLRDLDVFAPKGYPDIRFVVISEENVAVPLFSSSISKGMLRTLYILLLLEYMLQKEKPTVLLIDDFCEGLDYSRSIAVGRMVYDFCKDSGIQLITASNDSYLMDVVSLDCWHILYREGGEVRTINKYNNPKIFEDFEFTGLNNFHLFSSDFVSRHLKGKKK